MDWRKIVRVYATSYARERCDDALQPIIDIEEVEPGMWRVLFTPPILGADEDTASDIGLLVVTGEAQMKTLPVEFQRIVKHEDEDGDSLLWAWPLQELAE